MLDNLTPPEVSPELREYIKSITAKRARTVLDHLLEYGYITTDDLKSKYGYDHPPRAARDVRECGITLITKMVPGPNGRKMAAYVLAADTFASARKQGRKAFSKGLKIALLKRDGEQCILCSGKYPLNTLQVDHKVPYEVSGDPEGEPPEEYMLLCTSCNRSKSWTCEHCENWKGAHVAAICNTCMFGSPHSYEHIAMKQIRSLTLTWNEEEVRGYDSLRQKALVAGKSISDYIKDTLKLH